MASYVVIVPDNTYACRVCLAAVNTKLYSLHSNELSDLYEELISTPVCPTDGLPQYICSYCKALLLKAVAFRRKCRNAISFLQNVMVKQPITMHFLRSIKSPFQLPYAKNPVKIIDIITNDCLIINSEIKEELDVESLSKDLNGTFGAEESKIIKENDFINLKVNNIDDNVGFFGNDGGDALSKGGLIDGNDEKVCEVKAESLLQNDAVFLEDDNVADTDEDYHENCIGIRKSKPRLCKKTNVNAKSKKVVRKKSNNESRLGKVRKAKIVQTEKLNKRIQENMADLKKSKNPVRQMFLGYLTRKYENESEEYDNKDVVEIVTDEEINEGGTGFIIKEDTEMNPELPSDITLTIPKQIFYMYIKDIYVKKKTKFEFKLPRRRVNFDLMDVNRKNKLEDFGKDYNFSVKVFSDEEQKQYLQRLADKSKECTFRCEQCLRGFSFEASFKNHLKLFHDPSLGPASCLVCGKRFRDARRMQIHALVHKYQLQCNQCGQICRDTSLAKTHHESHKGQQFPCLYCDEVFTKYKSRTNHMSLRHAQLTCEICYKKLAGMKAVPLHRSLKHRETFECGVCKIIFNTEEARKQHVDQTPSDAVCTELFPCAACGDNFRTENEQKEHIEKQHSKTERRTPCCPCRCRGKTKVPRPLTAASGRKRSCGCYCSFRELNKEPSFAAGRKRQKYMCEICAKCKFQSLAHLRMHQLVHTGEKPFACDHCEKRFRTKTGLQTHLTSHTGERNYPCSFCDKKFLSPSGLHRHQKSVHLKLRPHRCEMCSKMYTTSTDLKLHIRTAHLNMPWPKRVRTRRRKNCEQ